MAQPRAGRARAR
uniref:Uncharacterized protein n=1 Tax=Macrostomum lignano TaxID=282301 RepID=A0A1I8FAH2_9PLAT